jgi:microcystin-dependent protein
MFAGTFAPAGWMFCAGQLLPISEYETLFQLIGTTYGGDGQETFALPDLSGRIPIHQGFGFTLGQTGGAEEITLAVNQIPSHSHVCFASADVPTLSNPANNLPGQGAAKYFRSGTPTVPLSSDVIAPGGGSQPHTNFQPYLCVHFIISLFGLFPQSA